jgi:hypothetical protein
MLLINPVLLIANLFRFIGKRKTIEFPEDAADYYYMNSAWGPSSINVPFLDEYRKRCEAQERSRYAEGYDVEINPNGLTRVKPTLRNNDFLAIPIINDSILIEIKAN